jgi:hypothetical protein
MLGKIKAIEVVTSLKIAPVASLNGKGGRLGIKQMLNTLFGYSELDGYKVETDKHIYHVLIDNGQS